MVLFQIRFHFRNNDLKYFGSMYYDNFHQIFNDALTVLGIDNANTDKKERLITNEVESNDQSVNYYLNCWYNNYLLHFG